MLLKKIILIAILSLRLMDAKGQVFIGKVIDAFTKPVAGALVHLMNTQLEAVTNAQGIFSLQTVPPGKYGIIVSSPGYATVNQDITITAPAVNIVIQLRDVSIQLSD